MEINSKNTQKLNSIYMIIIAEFFHFILKNTINSCKTD